MINLKHLIILLVFGLFPSLLIAAEPESPTTTGEASTTSSTAPVEETIVAVDPSLKRQQQLALELEAQQSSQDVIWLKTAGDASLALYRQDETGKRLGSLILVPDLGSEVGQSSLINYLAKSLTSKGWSTLSIAMPSQQTDTPTKDTALIAAAITSAQSQQNGDIYLVMLGRHQQTFNNLPETTKGLVLINLPTDKKSKLPSLLSTSTIPVLDIIATRDHFMKKASFQRRKNLAKSSNLKYRQLVFEGVNREFSGVEKGISRTISAWLKKQTEEL